MSQPEEILAHLLCRVEAHREESFVCEEEVRQKVELVCTSDRNRACARFLMACLLASLHRPEVDPRKPYTAIQHPDAFSGRSYDEAYITAFIHENNLPLNPTTAFLTPAFRNLDKPLTLEVELVGRPRKLYKATLELLDLVHAGKISAEDLLSEIIRLLLRIRDERNESLKAKLEQLSKLSSVEDLPPSAEDIIGLLEQHLKCKDSSRLPVLIIAAAYQAIQDRFGEYALPLHSHTAADKQTLALGDVEICVENDDNIVTVYEVKMRQIELNDLKQALEKISQASRKPHNYIFVTTEAISEEVKKYAASCYVETGGIEVAVLDIMGFLRHFVHFFHRYRLRFLEAYQELLLREPESAVRHELKETFLSLRLAMETGSGR